MPAGGSGKFEPTWSTAQSRHPGRVSLTARQGHLQGCRLTGNASRVPGTTATNGPPGSSELENLVRGLADHGSEGVVLLVQAQSGGFKIRDPLTKELVLTSEAGGDARVCTTHVAEESLGHECFLRGVELSSTRSGRLQE